MIEYHILVHLLPFITILLIIIYYIAIYYSLL